MTNEITSLLKEKRVNSDYISELKKELVNRSDRESTFVLSKGNTYLSICYEVNNKTLGKNQILSRVSLKARNGLLLKKLSDSRILDSIISKEPYWKKIKDKFSFSLVDYSGDIGSSIHFFSEKRQNIYISFVEIDANNVKLDSNIREKILDVIASLLAEKAKESITKDEKESISIALHVLDDYKNKKAKFISLEVLAKIKNKKLNIKPNYYNQLTSAQLEYLGNLSIENGNERFAEMFFDEACKNFNEENCISKEILNE